MKNLEFMQLCVKSGFDMYNENWISEYLENPDFIEYTDYYVKKSRSPTASDDESSLSPEATSSPSLASIDESEANLIMLKTDQELNELLNMDEYFFERFHSKKFKLKSDNKANTDVARRIYSFIRHSYTNPLSLKEISRIKIRRHLLTIDYKMKFKIQLLPLPNRLKDYLLMNEFNL
jgi:hypothetical protein